ncbi:MAG TPA: M1 family metallopeptidase, partial [Parvularculaceae bacterium]|nr:M1 family metallopeptidase [Parvularculaceae bacterium]
MKRFFVPLALAFVVAGGAARAGAAVADRVVLPTNVVPTHYDVWITPNAAELTFKGAVTIDIDVKQATKTIELNAADLKFDSVSLDDSSAEPSVSFDAEESTATLTFPAAVTAGAHKLTIAYSGMINQHPAGLFALDYGSGKEENRALYTQFENSDARRFMPCWDEPGLKATFTLTATVPADEMAISNMPAASATPLPGGLKKVVFAESPKMSSYLLFFGLGDFERISKKVGDVDVGVITTKGNASKGEFALDAEAHLLPYYENYFGVKFPLPKLDLIAAPGDSQSFGAMENWGAIFYFERTILIDPKISTKGDERTVYIVVAHETAHQWFGDLVTMA